LISIITYAYQTNLSNYYPSPSGSYTKAHLINGSGGPNQKNATGGCFCAAYTNSLGVTSNGFKAGLCDTGEPTGPGFGSYPNTGTIFADSSTGYLEICKNDGTVASYPGSCFNRYSASSSFLCPKNYTASSHLTQSAFGNMYSWSCCFTGEQAGSTPTQSGCFSTYSSAVGIAPAQPTYCNPKKDFHPLILMLMILAATRLVIFHLIRLPIKEIVAITHHLGFL